MTGHENSGMKSQGDKIRTYIVLHLFLLLYSIGGICSKYAGQADFLSFRFFLFYGLVLLNLAIYAIAWQQILKKLPLVTAYANKAVTIIWGVCLGAFIFGESITISKVIGSAIIVAGVIMVVKADED